MGKRFHQGDIVYYDHQPFAYALCPSQRKLRCDKCFIPINQVKSYLCLDCRYVRFCSLLCQRNSMIEHRSECPKIKQRPIGTVARMILRILNKMQYCQSFTVSIYGILRTWDRLMDHCEEIAKNMDSMLSFGSIVEDLEYYLGNIEDVKLIFQIYGKIMINSFAVTDSETGQVIGKVLYLGASMFDHSCQPDLYFQFDGISIYFIAVHDLTIRTEDENGEEKALDQFHISYIDEMMPVFDRQHILQSSYYFQCKCARCSEDSRPYPINNARLSAMMSLIDEYFNSDHICDLIRLVLDYLMTQNNRFDRIERVPRNYNNFIEQINQLNRFKTKIEECQEILLESNELDLVSSTRLRDFLACLRRDANEIDQLSIIYSQYYGRRHPRLLQRTWLWIALLLIDLWSKEKDMEKSKLIRSLIRKAKIMKEFLKLKPCD